MGTQTATAVTAGGVGDSELIATAAPEAAPEAAPHGPPPALTVPEVVPEQQQETADGVEHLSTPVLNVHALLNRPFADVLRETVSAMQLKCTAHLAAEQLLFLASSRDHDADVLACRALMVQLLTHLREAPAQPTGGSCMAVLAHLCRTPAGRCALRVEGVLEPLLK